jgi:hypothetical protein
LVHQPSSFEQRERYRLVPGVVLPQFRPLDGYIDRLITVILIRPLSP